MGAEDFDGVIHAPTKEEAQLRYARKAPMAPYDGIWHCVTDVEFYEETFLDKTEALRFLYKRARKWGPAVMCKCGVGIYIYAVILAT